MKFLEDRKAAANLVPLVLAVVIAFAMLFIGAFINGTIHSELSDSFGTFTTTGVTGDPESRALARMNNSSRNWDSALDIVQVVIIISILAAAIGAIFLFTRFGG